MNSKVTGSVLFFLSALSPLAAHGQKDASLWLTNADRSALFQQQTTPLPLVTGPATNQIIDVDDTKTFQTIDGFGFAVYWRQRTAYHAYGLRETCGNSAVSSTRSMATTLGELYARQRRRLRHERSCLLVRRHA